MIVWVCVGTMAYIVITLGLLHWPRGEPDASDSKPELRYSYAVRGWALLTAASWLLVALALANRASGEAIGYRAQAGLVILCGTAGVLIINVFAWRYRVRFDDTGITVEWPIGRPVEIRWTAVAKIQRRKAGGARLLLDSGKSIGIMDGVSGVEKLMGAAKGKGVEAG